MLSASQSPAMKATSDRVLVMVVAGADCVKHHSPTMARTRLDTLTPAPFLTVNGNPVDQLIILFPAQMQTREKHINSRHHCAGLRPPCLLGSLGSESSLVRARVEHLIQTLHLLFLFLIVSLPFADDSTGDGFL